MTFQPPQNNPSWWFFTNPSEKYAQVKLDHLPNFRGENGKYLKPPLRIATKKKNVFWGHPFLFQDGKLNGELHVEEGSS